MSGQTKYDLKMSLAIVISILTLMSITIGATVKFTSKFAENDMAHSIIMSTMELQQTEIRHEIKDINKSMKRIEEKL